MENAIDYLLQNYKKTGLIIILLFCLSYLAAWIFFKFKIQQNISELTKDIENLKSKNEKTNYISKVQFDAEYKMYQEISLMSNQTVISCSTAILGADEFKDCYDENVIDENINKLSHKMLNEISSFNKTVFKYSPFINQQIYIKLENIIDIAQKIASETSKTLAKSGKIKFQSDEFANLTEYCNKLHKKHKEFISELRNYLKNLTVQ